MLAMLPRAIALALVALSVSGCCTALDTVCDCVSCLANGPRLPFLIAPTPLPAPPAAPAAPARASIGATMAY